jgi:hypothetical protein
MILEKKCDVVVLLNETSARQDLRAPGTFEFDILAVEDIPKK